MKYQDMYVAERKTMTLSTREYVEKYVDREATMKACVDCPNYDNNWACPSFNDNPYRYWQEYDNIMLILTKINFTNEAQQKKHSLEELGRIIDNTLFMEKTKLVPELEEEEKKVDGIYLSAGFCTNCSECTRINNVPCKYPDRCRYSIESLGGLVGDTLSGVFDENIKWIDMDEGKLPENLSLLMAVLY